MEETVDNLGGAILADNALIKYEKLEDKGKGIVKNDNDKYRKVIRNKMIGVLLIKNKMMGVLLIK